MFARERMQEQDEINEKQFSIENMQKIELQNIIKDKSNKVMEKISSSFQINGKKIFGSNESKFKYCVAFKKSKNSYLNIIR